MADSAHNTGMVLSLALSYGGREEILRAARLMAEALSKGELAANAVEEKDFEQFLWTNGLPPLDLVVRTSGELRVSNFLLWQAAYAELYFTDMLWPDFDGEALSAALAEFGRRERRYGGL